MLLSLYCFSALLTLMQPSSPERVQQRKRRRLEKNPFVDLEAADEDEEDEEEGEEEEANSGDGDDDVARK